MYNCAYIWIDQPVPVSVSVAQSPVNPVPAGNSVTFTATPTNGGTTPVYQWMVNGLNVGANSAAYTYFPVNGDAVTCVLTSNAYCVSGNPATAAAKIVEVEGVPSAITVTGIIASGNDRCYSATQTLTVAGVGKTFTVNSGGSSTMIAGQNILYLAGTTVKPGGYMHGYITTDNLYCGQKSPSLPKVVDGEDEPVLISQTPSFRIYPNPTSGNFTVEQKSAKTFDHVMIEVYGMRGEKIMSDQMAGMKIREFSISGISSGVYFVKVVTGEYVETIKLIKTQ
jgi:hypothetical protein